MRFAELMERVFRLERAVAQLLDLLLTDDLTSAERALLLDVKGAIGKPVDRVSRETMPGEEVMF